MKKILLVLTLTLGILVSNAQTKVIKLLHWVDKMEDVEYLEPNWNLIAIKNPQTKQGFWIRPSFKKKEDGLWYYDGLVGMANKVGYCHEEDYLIILFEDSSKVRVDMWNRFNCSGDIYLDWDKSIVNELKIKPIKSMRLVNGRSFDSYDITYTKKEDKNYFINVFKALDEYNSKN